MTTREDLLRAMQSGNAGKSALNMRNENAQQSNRVAHFNRLKKEEKKKSKILVEMEYAVPFNPATGKPDDNYNADCKFRPTFSATSTAKLLKGYANDNPEAKEVFMRNAGVTEWDTSDVENVNDDDFAVFRPYWVPRIFSLPTVNCNIQSFTNSKNMFGTQYEVNVEYDNMGNIVGELPAILRGYNLFNDVYFEKVNRLKEENPNIADKALSDAKTQYRQEIPMSGLRPSNWVLLFEIPLDNTFRVSADAKFTTKADVADMIKITNLSVALKEQLGMFIDGSYKDFISSPNFVELDMACSAKGANNQVTTSFSIAPNKIKDDPNYDTLCGHIADVIDECENIEQKVRASSFVRKYTDAEDCAFTETFHTVFDINNPLVTDKIVLKNAQFISEAFGEAGDARIAAATATATDADITAAEAPVTKQDITDTSAPETDETAASGKISASQLFADMTTQVTM